MTITTGFPDLLSEVRAFRARYPEVRHVDLLSLDIPGHFYGKRYPVDMLEKVAAGSPLKLPQNCVLLGVQGGLFPIGDYCFSDGDPDAVRRLIPGTLKPVTWEREPLGQMLISSDGTAAPIEFEPREVLARVLQRLARRGIRPVVAFELEFYLFERALKEGLPQFPRDPFSDDPDDQPNMHIERLSRFSDVLRDMVETANAQGVDANVITAELGPGQFEINFGHCDDGLRAADWAALFCRSTRGVALKHGLRASFMSKPYLHAPAAACMYTSACTTTTATTCWLPMGNARCAMRWQAAWRSCRTACRSLQPTTMRSVATVPWSTPPAVRAGAMKTAMRAYAFPSPMYAICALSIVWLARTPTLTWCWRQSCAGWSMGWMRRRSRSHR
jgi:hypothetical protein